MRITIVLTLTALIFLSSCSLALASVNEIGESRIHPASPFYFLKTLRENLELKFAGTPRVRMLRQLEFGTRRLREVKSLIPTTHQDLIFPNLERYSSYISSLPDKDLTDEEAAARIKESLVIHLNVLQTIYDQISNREAKMAIRSVLNRIIKRADVPISAKLPVCNFLSKEASSSALNEVERTILLERAIICQKAPANH